MPFAGAAAPWPRTGRARLVDTSARIRGAVRKRRAWARARRQAVRIIHDDLGLRPGQGLEALLAAAVRERRRPVTVLKLALPAHVSGFCVRGETEDTIVVTANTSERQGLHVLLHELYHLLCGEPPEPSPSAFAACDLLDLGELTAQLPSLPADVVAEVLTRPAQLRAGNEAYEEDEEWAAEVFATVGLLMLSLDTEEGAGALTPSPARGRGDR
ncbi:hypothetical protein RB200_39635 [Streptomyces sp. PmtG]